jgi:hypothetical protein
MRTLVITTTAALALAGCSTAPPPVEGSPPARHISVFHLPEQPAHDDERALGHPAEPADQDDPVAVAVGLIIEGLAEQDLEVVDLGVETLAATPSNARVRIAATHRTQTGVPHTSVYELDLARDAEGPWRLVGFRQSQ